MPKVISTLAEAKSRVKQLLSETNQRVILGIVGKPGAGKSTLSEELLEYFGSANSVIVPMDGFHLSNLQLDKLKIGRAHV